MGSERSTNRFFFIMVSSFLTPIMISSLFAVNGQRKPWTTTVFPPELAARLQFDTDSINQASTDFGNVTRAVPAAVLYPCLEFDIATLVRLSYSCQQPFAISARGRSHSTHGQALVANGVAIEMRALNGSGEDRIKVVSLSPQGSYVDVGGEQLWVDVLQATLKHGLTPLSWTDYLYLTVGGTLSNAGISGQAFLHGPQISNVYEMDVITGKGENVTCSKEMNSELFYAVLGGLGQFGIITRARIALGSAPQRVRWVRLIYTDYFKFTRDGEYLISLNNKDGLDYIEGSVVNVQSLSINDWRSSSLFTEGDCKRIRALAAKHHMIYCLEVASFYGYYSHGPTHTVHQVDIDQLLERLSPVAGFVFRKDVTYTDFLDRVHKGELKLREKGLWDVPHPWLNLFIPKSKFQDFDQGVFRGILKKNATVGHVLVYPMNKNKWDERMSIVLPDEEVFYTVGLLRSAVNDNWESLEDQNKEILDFCDKAELQVKQYLAHHQTTEEWKRHFGKKWSLFVERKAKFDPKAILSPGQNIFNGPISREIPDQKLMQTNFSTKTFEPM